MQKENKTVKHLMYSSAKNWLMLVLVFSIIGSAFNALVVPVIISNGMLVDAGSIILAIFGWVNLGLLTDTFIKVLKEKPAKRLVFKLIYGWLLLSFVISLSNVNTVFNIFAYTSGYGYYGSSLFSSLRTGVIIFQLLIMCIPVLVVYVTDKKVAALEQFYVVEAPELLFENVEVEVTPEVNGPVVAQEDVEVVSENVLEDDSAPATETVEVATEVNEPVVAKEDVEAVSENVLEDDSAPATEVVEDVPVADAQEESTETKA